MNVDLPLQAQPVPFYFPRVMDLITYKRKIYRIVKINRTRLVMEDEAGKQYTLPLDLAVKAPEGTEFNSVVDNQPPAQRLEQGTVVEYTDRLKARRPGLYVILRDNGGSYSLVRLGGDNGRYIRGESPRNLKVVDPARITVATD